MADGVLVRQYDLSDPVRLDGELRRMEREILRRDVRPRFGREVEATARWVARGSIVRDRTRDSGPQAQRRRGQDEEAVGAAQSGREARLRSPFARLEESRDARRQVPSEHGDHEEARDVFGPDGRVREARDDEWQV